MWRYTKSDGKGLSAKKIASEQVKRTVVVRAFGIDGGNPGKGNVTSGLQRRLMGHLVEALRESQHPQSKPLWVYGSYLHRIDPLLTFVLGEGSPLTPDKWLSTALLVSRSWSSLYGREEGEEKSQDDLLGEAGHTERPLERSEKGCRRR